MFELTHYRHLRSTKGFEQTEGIVAAIEALCLLDLTALSDEQISGR